MDVSLVNCFAAKEEIIATYIVFPDVLQVLQDKRLLSQEESETLRALGGTLKGCKLLAEVLNQRLSLKEFIGVLQESGCQVLVEFLLDGPKCDELRVHGAVFDIMKKETCIVDFIIALEFAQTCRQHGLLNERDIREIEECDPQAANQLLLNRINKRSIFWFPEFAAILRTEGLGELLPPMEIPETSDTSMPAMIQIGASQSSPAGDEETEPKQRVTTGGRNKTQLDLRDLNSWSSSDDETPLKRPLSPMGETDTASDDTGSVTDNNQPGQPDSELKLMKEQLPLVQSALEGKNVMIVAPTNSGKTFMAMYIMKTLLEHPPPNKNCHILFLAPKRLLVNQHRDCVRKYLHEYKTKALTGDGQCGAKIELDLIYKRYHIVVVTPQILLDRLDDRSIESLSVFSLLVFDECHHTTENHPYNGIMKKYIMEKMEGKKDLPQLLGLTASPGVDKATNVNQALEHILKLSANLDVTQVAWNKDLHNTAGEEKRVALRKRNIDAFGDRVSRIMETIEERLLAQIQVEVDQLHERDQAVGLPGLTPSDRASQAYMQWLAGDMKQLHPYLQNPDNLSMMVASLQWLKIFHKSLLLNADCLSSQALDYIRNKSERFDSKKHHVLERIFADNIAPLTEFCRDPQYNDNPGLAVLKREILQGLREEADVRVIVFCKTRKSTECVAEWMTEDEELRKFKPAYVVGQNTSEDSTTQTQYHQDQIIRKFREGGHQVVVSTPVTEEGMDIGALKLVINYKHVTNEIARIQSKGRRRKEGARYVVLAEEKVLQKDVINEERELLMYEALLEVVALTLQEFQKRVKEKQRLAFITDELAKSNGRPRMTDEVWELHCADCNELLCYNFDVRLLKGLRVVIDEEFVGKVFEVSCSPTPWDEFTQNSMLCCKSEKSDKVCGAIVGFIVNHNQMDYFQLVLGALIFDDGQGHRLAKKNWKQTKFLNVQDITIEDKEKIVQFKSMVLTKDDIEG